MTKPVIGLTGMRHTRTTTLPGLPLQGVALSDDYTLGVQSVDGIPMVIPFLSDDVTLGELARRLDGLLLTGGEDVDPATYGQEPRYGLGDVVAERDRLEISLVQMMRAQGKPILGICRGMQVLNVALGGTLYQDIPREWKGKTQHSQKASRNHLSHRVKLERASRLATCFGGKTSIRVNSFHHQAVKDIAKPLRAVAWDAEGLVEGIESKEGPFALAVQWHPENLWRDDETVLGLFRALVDACRDS
ncbi:gamma-glutamyl-gamma-aminobutyrate hydrolase family protein [Alicyclobacillus fastidiosus]|uniref:Gamma-glutamyl-gamma-aminobutyrate hydrolase family protein n=1 Tax=Alicyclobacillus fastidiosus TaxID=392011 RepID=A0ABV5AEZ4_9BACL|nr:gamma-glutamyl-gamma-aminobutyrate hydrolase family protein [Alicyclobacillus fastidiosus]WEH09429.1 gamma-glutamyl-gamma-aminobutyrate hydrolase family protein [Alicyclobacillus fastidiosus]